MIFFLRLSIEKSYPKMKGYLRCNINPGYLFICFKDVEMSKYMFCANMIWIYRMVSYVLFIFQNNEVLLVVMLS